MFSFISLPTPCKGTISNKTKDFIYSVTSTNGAAGTYELMIQGSSMELALKQPSWVERHRLYISIGFDSELRPSFTVVDFEPMLRTTKDLPLEQDTLFEYIPRSQDTNLSMFEGRIKTAIYNGFESAIDKYERKLKKP